MYTVFPYYYRDASNFKEFDQFVVQGELSPEELAHIGAKLESQEFFIPGDLAPLGIAELQPRMASYPSDDDHVWHTLGLGDISTTETVPEGTAVISKEALLKAFAAITGPEGWDVSGAMDRLGLF